MMAQQWKREFIEFLKHEKALDYYEDNVRRFWEITTVHELTEMLENSDCLTKKWLKASFSFRKTFEGPDYWRYMSFLWETYVELFNTKLN